MTKMVCKRHGPVDPYIRPDGAKICRRCRQADVIKKQKDLKRRAVELKGGKCQDCHCDSPIEILQFHNPSKRKQDLPGGTSCTTTMSWEKLQMHLEDCVLLCANCHIKRHVVER